MIIVPNTVAASILTALVGVAGILNGALLKLFKNDVIPNVGTILADLVEADFTGYAASAAITWSVPVLGDDGLYRVIGDNKSFIAGSPLTVPNTIYGYYVTNGAGTVLLFAERYANSKIINTAHQAIVEVAEFGASSQSGS